jgi:hypothetical protein
MTTDRRSIRKTETCPTPLRRARTSKGAPRRWPAGELLAGHLGLSHGIEIVEGELTGSYALVI